jgi:hypothetical protein
MSYRAGVLAPPELRVLISTEAVRISREFIDGCRGAVREAEMVSVEVRSPSAPLCAVGRPQEVVVW